MIDVREEDCQESWKSLNVGLYRKVKFSDWKNGDGIMDM